MPREIVVTTGSRLHFGFLSCKPPCDRQFGGAGLMIDSPGYEIAVRESNCFSVIGSPAIQTRVETLAIACTRSKVETPLPLREGLGEGRDAGCFQAARNDFSQGAPPPVAIEVRSEIPSHAGLGSGTQLALAVAAALSALHGREDINPDSLAICTARGARSALGIHGFQRGGFLVDAGKYGDNEIGTLAARADFPATWRMLLVTPKIETGLSGAHEQDAFARLPPMPRAQTDQLCGIALTELLPAVIDADFDRCGEALYEFGSIVGNYFAPVQGGTYASPSTAELVEHLRASGVRGVGQTSWGPTIFALCRDDGEAAKLSADLQADTRWSDCQFRIAAAKNTGAQMRAADI
ncbi:MAG: beta-ribofuranosylaminobenzene 5'-phosphate synthase family protein [Planctomycetaceae bacterium]